MRKVIYYVASSLDGYIARANGEVDWLFTDQDYGYESFYSSVDTLLMGRTTYEQVLGWGPPFPYAGKRILVFSSTMDPSAAASSQPQGAAVQVVPGDPVAAVKALKAEAGGPGGRNGAIWVVGGSRLAAPLVSAGLVDEMVLSFHPVLLGGGIPMFREGMRETRWRVAGSRTYHTGLVQLTYQLAEADGATGGEGTGDRDESAPSPKPPRS